MVRFAWWTRLAGVAVLAVSMAGCGRKASRDPYAYDEAPPKKSFISRVNPFSNDDPKPKAQAQAPRQTRRGRRQPAQQQQEYAANNRRGPGDTGAAVRSDLRYWQKKSMDIDAQIRAKEATLVHSDRELEMLLDQKRNADMQAAKYRDALDAVEGRGYSGGDYGNYYPDADYAAVAGPRHGRAGGSRDARSIVEPVNLTPYPDDYTYANAARNGRVVDQRPVGAQPRSSSRPTGGGVVQYDTIGSDNIGQYYQAPTAAKATASSNDWVPSES